MKIRPRIIIIAALLLFMGIIGTGLKEPEGRQAMLPDTTLQKDQILELLNTRTSMMLTDENISVRQQNISDLMFEKECQMRSMIKQYREKLSDLNESYRDSRSEIEIIDTRIQEERNLSLIVKETTFLTIEQTGTETGYTAEHEFIFEKGLDEKWILTEDRQLERTGLLPLEQAEELLYKDQISEKIEIKNQLSDNSIPIIDIQEKNISLAGGYNYTAMATYLERYWKNYNSAYRDFTNKGGDCTNFVSQALRAGGWPDKPGYYQNANYWWYNILNQTYSWTSVNHWATFAINSGRTYLLGNVWSCRIGDVVQVKPYQSSSKIHTMMVSYNSGGMPYFTYHTSNRYRRSLNQVILDWPGATFYSYRT